MWEKAAFNIKAVFNDIGETGYTHAKDWKLVSYVTPYTKLTKN